MLRGPDASLSNLLGNLSPLASFVYTKHKQVALRPDTEELISFVFRLHSLLASLAAFRHGETHVSPTPFFGSIPGKTRIKKTPM